MKNLKRILFSCYTLIVILFVNFNVSAQPDTPKDTETYKYFKTKHIWDAKVTIADMIVVGESKRGVRRVIPITGGTFDGPEIKGEVLSGGEDWQLVRPDGDTELHARYLLKTNDGYIIQITNQALQHNPENGKQSPYIRSVMDIEAPVDSPYDYLNHAIFLGTLQVPELKPGEKPYVIIGAYQLL